WERVGRSDGKFDEKKFADVAFEHLKRPDLTPPEVYAERVRPFLSVRGLEEPSPDVLAQAIPTIRERAHTLVEAADLLDFFLREPPVLDPDARPLLTPESAPHLEGLRRVVAEVQSFTAPELEMHVKQW